MSRALVSFVIAALLIPVAAPGEAAASPSHGLAMQAAAAPTVDRVSGPDRFATASAVSQAWKGPVDLVYVVSGRNFPDALAASARAGRDEAPVLLTDRASIPSATRSALQRLDPARIVVSGGSAVITDATVRELGSYARTGIATRVAGANRYATSAALAADYSPEISRVYLASGENFPDALSTAALAGVREAPLLLTSSGSLHSSVAAQLRRLKPREVVVVGGTAAVSKATARSAAAYAEDPMVKRIAGANLYDTSRMIAARFPKTSDTAYLASGAEFPDGLVGAALAARDGAPVLLTPRNRIHRETGAALHAAQAQRVRVLGGANALTRSVVGAIPGAIAGVTEFEALVLELTNVQRRKAGCRTLAPNGTLTAAAREHSDDMIVRDYFAHASPDGETVVDRVNSWGYQWRGLAENLAAGQRTPHQVVTAWMDSPGHRRNIVNCAYVDLGVGLSYGASGTARPHWTQKFGIPRE